MSNKVFPIYIAESKINGKGSFASRQIKRGEVINIIGGTEYSEREVDDLIEKGKLRVDDDFQIDEDKFLVGPGKDYFTNHSCDPNAGIKNVKQIVAIRDIEIDEEITIDYSTISAPPPPRTIRDLVTKIGLCHVTAAL